MKKIILVFIFFSQFTSKGQVDNYAKNSKIFDDEQTRFEAELRSNKDSAEVYWRHANATAQFTFNAQKDAWKYYEKAISIDSSKVQYFIDYGNYIFNTLKNYKTAKEIYEHGLKIYPTNSELTLGVENINKRLLKIEENIKAAYFGKAIIKAHPSGWEYSKITNFDSLIKLTKNKKSAFYYNDLLDKFNADSNLSDEKVYMLLVGFTLQKEYKPYGQEASPTYQLNNDGYFDDAIVMAKDLLTSNPLLPALYKEIIYAYRKKGDTAIAEQYVKRLQRILDAMLYSGDGTCERPYVAVWVREEYTLLKYLNLKKSGSVNTGMCGGSMADKIDVTNISTQEQSIICFNIKLPFGKL